MSPRTDDCGRPESVARYTQAQRFLELAELASESPADAAMPQAGAANAVMAGIAASDAVCCAKLGYRPRGQDHREAIAILGSITGAEQMAKDLRRLLDIKDAAQYSTSILAVGKSSDAVEWARRMVSDARSLL